MDRKQRRANQLKVVKGPNIKNMKQITVNLPLSKSDMEEALTNLVLRINGVLYDMPRYQMQNYLDNNQEGLLKFTLTKAKSQELPKPPEEKK